VQTGNLERAVTWAGLRPGDPVDVKGPAIRGATWAFVAFVRNTRTGAEWVEVVGGKAGDRMIRSFPPERVFPPVAGRGRGAAPASLADAPQLPLG
jgi:hypothetical protein